MLHKGLELHVIKMGQRFPEKEYVEPGKTTVQKSAEVNLTFGEQFRLVLVNRAEGALEVHVAVFEQLLYKVYLHPGEMKVVETRSGQPFVFYPGKNLIAPTILVTHLIDETLYWSKFLLKLPKEVTCPKCNAVMPYTNVHCQTCGGLLVGLDGSVYKEGDKPQW